MPNSLMTELLASYVPRLIQRRVAKNPTPIDAPLARTFQAVVLFADISGFTALTDELVEKGPAGVETLARVLNEYFGQIIDLVYEYDGDAMKFAGDGVIAAWSMPSEGGDANTVSDEERHKWTLRATECAFKIKEALSNYQAEGSRLYLKCSLGTGPVWESHIGGIFNRWEFVLVGKPLIEIGLANTIARAGDVVASPSVWDVIKDDSEAEEIYLTGKHAGSARLKRLRSIAPPLGESDSKPVEIPDEAQLALRPYIPGSIINRISAGHSDWLAELRKVTILFISLPEISRVTSLEIAHELMRLIQRVIYRFEGSVSKISQDDKGVVVDAAFGLPPLAHANDPVRGLQAAMMLRSELKALGVYGVISLTTGRVFCGLVGTSYRREYTFLGNSVNLAGRLIGVAFQLKDAFPHDNVAIVCDRSTFDAAYERVEFEPLPPQTVKGRNKPVEVFHPLREKKDVLRTKTELIGRRDEKILFADAIQEIQRGASFRAIILQGEAGIGKSRLMEELVRQAQALQMKILMGTGNAVERNNPYFAWRPIFNLILGIDEFAAKPQLGDDDRLQILETVTEKLNAMDGDLVRYLPLLSVVLPIAIPENEFTSAMTGEVRGDNIRALLGRLLQEEARRSTLLVALEDAQWLDSASWALLGDVHQRVRPLLLALSTRPLIQPIPPPFMDISERPETHLIRLDMMSLEEVEHLVCQRLGVVSVPSEAGKLIRAKSEGHPFFAEELAYALRDSGVLVIQGTQCHLAPGLTNLDAVSLPDNLEAAITSRIDGLNPSQQLTLKVASVIGRIFAFRILHAIHPIEADKPELNQYLDTLTRLSLTLVESETPDLTYLFKHAITQEVAYNLMLYSQRRQLHQAVAEWIEASYGNDNPSYFALLAHHWLQAIGGSDPGPRSRAVRKAVNYLEKAGDQSLSNFANAEAVQVFTDLLKLKEEVKPSRLQLGQWYRKMAMAYLAMGKLPESKSHYLKALEILGQRVPVSGLGMIGATLRELARQTSHRLFPRLHRGRVTDPELEAIRLEIVQIMQDYATILFVMGDPNPLPLFHCVLTGLNTAESIRDTPELAYMNAQMGALCGFIPLRGQYQHYTEQWRALNERFYNPKYFVGSVIALATVESGIGAWQSLRERLEKVIEIGNSLGNHRSVGEALSFMACNALLEGNVALAEADCARMLEAVGKRNTAHTVWYYQWAGSLLLRCGGLDRIEEHIERALAIMEKTPAGELSEIAIKGYRADALWRTGDQDAALTIATDLLKRSANIQVVNYTSYVTFVPFMDVIFLALERAHEQDRSQNERDELMEQAKLCIKIMKAYARVFTVGESLVHRYTAWVEWYSGRPEKAYQAWRVAADKARTFPMNYEEGLANLELARHLPVDGEERRARYEQARSAFARGGYENWVEVVDRLRSA